MKHLNLERYALVVFAIFAVCFLLTAYFGETPDSLTKFLQVAYATIPQVILVIGFFVSYAWKWRIFQGWLVPFPNLNGTWRGTIQSNWVDPTTGKTIPPIPVSLSIRQSFINISCVQRTGESLSNSFAAGFWLDSDEQIRRLVYSYENKPNATVAHRSKPHTGTMCFEIINDPVTKLEGDYFTSRSTSGRITLTFHSKKCMDEIPRRLKKHPMDGK